MEDVRHVAFLIRKKESAFSMGSCRIVDQEHRYILGYARGGVDGDLLVLANFSDSPQIMRQADLYFRKSPLELIDIITGKLYQKDLCLQPWDLLWLKEVK